MTTPTSPTPTEQTTSTLLGRVFGFLNRAMSKGTIESSTRLISVCASFTMNVCLLWVTITICLTALRLKQVDAQLVIFAGGLVLGVGGVASIIGRHKEPG